MRQVNAEHLGFTSRSWPLAQQPFRARIHWQSFALLSIVYVVHTVWQCSGLRRLAMLTESGERQNAENVLKGFHVLSRGRIVSAVR